MQKRINFTTNKYICAELITLLAILVIYYGVFHVYHWGSNWSVFIIAITVFCTIRVIRQLFLLQGKTLTLKEDAVYLENEPCEMEYSEFCYTRMINITSSSGMAPSRLNLTKSMLSEQDWNELLKKCA